MVTLGTAHHLKGGLPATAQDLAARAGYLIAGIRSDFFHGQGFCNNLRQSMAWPSLRVISWCRIRSSMGRRRKWTLPSAMAALKPPAKRPPTLGQGRLGS